MEQQRLQMQQPNLVLDGDCRTMHIRCGHDIQHNLKAAGLLGDFNVHINPYLQGPVTDTPDWLQQRARFIVASAGTQLGLNYDNVLADLQGEEQRLESAINDYQRVVIWCELDSYDQLMLLRCLAWFAEHGAPRQLELISVNEFPGIQRFVGLGQLPPEALRLLWPQRITVGTQQIALGQLAWQAFTSADPRALATLMRSGTPLLPHLAPALRRHLQELPSIDNGLSLNQQLLLTTLARLGKVKVARLIGEVLTVRDPYSGLGDTGLDYELRQLELVQAPVLLREHRGHMRQDEIEITDVGTELIDGRRNLLTMQAPARWVGGICINAGQQNWRWDNSEQNVVWN